MGYYIDLSKISIDEYKAKLEASTMIPSRLILKEKTNERFNYFKTIGIHNVRELLQLLKKKDKFASLAKEKNLSEEYLTILLRELNSILPKPNKIKEFANISPQTVAKLEKTGIKDTASFFDNVKTPSERIDFAKITGISEQEILTLTQLTDLSRIKWVGVIFAQMLLEVGINSVEKASNANYVDLHKKLNEINKDKKFYKGQLGLNDIKLFVEAAKEVPQEIIYV